MKLYSHKTDGGAEYLCTSPVEGTNEGDLFTAIVRLDGEPELIGSAVRAVNSHDELVAALQTVTDHFADVMKNYPGATFENGPEGIPTIKRARAALQNATGEA